VLKKTNAVFSVLQQEMNFVTISRKLSMAPEFVSVGKKEYISFEERALEI